ncbi:vacuolar protein sorting-associated protein 54-like isoform X1 [Lingula anatina]|uniref:Vacuolar protein sorting-associated protein 54 n=1 Tax=Lingula anatina TaxID=7574 RepID=A0A1S3IUU9_LINAN|nr:vacuolar protein sorting-associated protein 54-like isoform X1 [Lingula anatina]XP_013401711.1 vacuolar protein sorting-associated protein 54-like isoform X1 [Lingula anatina]|eukprot:XP_013401710.1 vacuolar protein sorting-associated protein 54-like isoform X1 [Lingula anatina]
MATDELRRVATVAWKRCALCVKNDLTFKSPREFCRHLREYHCSKEGGSFVCRYGMNNVCPSLPVEGVSDKDYEDHVARDHVCIEIAPFKPLSQNSDSSGSSRSSTPVPTHSEPSVVQDQYKWTVYHSKVNLPAALNDPRLVKRESDFFTKTWGEAFDKSDIHPSPHLPEITRDHFMRYIRKISRRHKTHVKNNETLPVASADAGKSCLPVDLFPALAARQTDKSRVELDQIPKTFLSPSFSLENPDTFNDVFPWAQIEATRHGDEGPKQSSKLLQEKMSHYLDIVEVQIAKQISYRSEAFFHAMTSHDELQEYMTKTCAAIKHLRDRIHHLDSVLVRGPLTIMKLTKTRSNYAKLYNKLKLMATIHQTQPTIQMLLSTNEFVGALDLITTTQEVLSQELAGIHSFRHLGSQLAELEKVIDKMMQADFVKYATADLNRPLEDRQNSSVGHKHHPIRPLNEEKLVAIVFGMLRQHKYNFIDVYREEACTAMKAAVKQTVVEAVSTADDINVEGAVGSLADQMRLLNFPQWMELLNEIFENLTVILRRVKAFHDVISEVINVAAGRDVHHTQHRKVVENGAQHIQDGRPQEGEDTNDEEEQEESSTVLSRSISLHDEDADIMVAEPEYVKAMNNLKDFLCQTCEHAHDRCVKVIVARAKDGFLEKIGSNDFVTLASAIERFASECEHICGRKSMSLRGSLQSQANRFVNRFHEERKQKLSNILDIERWKQADVPEEFQDLVDHISATGKLSPAKKVDTEKRSASSTLRVGGEEYTVVGTVLILLKIIVEYCQCVEDIPTITPDMLTRLVDILKTFNSRTCQLVLGAGALQLVGLKTITTKNLALASRCLQLIAFYIPMAKAHFEIRLPAKQLNMLKYFDQVLKDYKDHISEISNKLVAIMGGMFELQLSKWEVKAPMPSACFRGVCKQIGKFHEAINELLPEQQVQDLFMSINLAFKQHLKQQLAKLGVSNDNGPKHGLVMADLAFYTGAMKSLAGLGSLDYNMESLWT